MSWFNQLLTSSIGRKLVMSLTGLFLIVFLVVHLIGNFQLLINDGGEQFNRYSYFMTHNPLIKTVSYLLYLTILVHAYQGIVLWMKNRNARGTNYAVNYTKNTSASSRMMGPLGIVILIFLILHLYQFWLQMKMGVLPKLNYDGINEPVSDLYTPVAAAFSNLVFVIVYVLSMVVIYLHLSHGFQSAFQTLGWNHKKYTPVVKTVGIVYSILVAGGFAIIPVVFYFLFRQS